MAIHQYQHLSGKNKKGLPMLRGKKGLHMQSNLVMIHPCNFNIMSDAQGQTSKQKYTKA